MCRCFKKIKLQNDSEVFMLTKKQKDLLDFICAFYNSEGLIPTYEEMCHATDAKSKGSIHQLLSALEIKGYIRRHKNKARSIEILKTSSSGPARLSSLNQEGDNTKSVDFFERVAASQTLSIPYFGDIVAGAPLENFYNDTTNIAIPLALLGPAALASPHSYFALKIMGDSMKNAGILDQDIVILKRASTANDGAIVAAIVDNRELTLKRIFFRPNDVYLEPANPDYMGQNYAFDRIRIEGVLVNLVRSYTHSPAYAQF
jgi:repressor LexA